MLFLLIYSLSGVGICGLIVHTDDWSDRKDSTGSVQSANNEGVAKGQKTSILRIYIYGFSSYDYSSFSMYNKLNNVD